MPEEMIADPSPLVPVVTPLTLLQIAVERGVDPDRLEKLMELQERYERNQAEKAYTGSMNACQAEMPLVIHDADNKFLKTTYVKLEGIQHLVKPIYTRHGFSLSWAEEPTEKAGFIRVICDVMHFGGHTKRYHGEYPIDGTGAKGGSNMNPLQGRVSSNTYAQRDMLRGIFNLTIAGYDMDGTEVSKIAPEEIGQINDLLSQCERAGRPVNFAKFLEWLGVTDLGNLLSREVKKAIAELQRKLREKK